MTVAITASINGFQPARPVAAEKVYTYPVTTGADTYAIGDAVALTSGAVTKLVLTDSPSALAVGVIVGLKDANGRPLVFNQPTRGNYLVAGQAGFAEVVIDTEASFMVRFTGTVNQALVGTNVRANDAGVQVATGVSGMSVRALSGAAAATNPFKVLSISDQVVAGGAGTDRYVEVRLNNSLFRAGTSS
jgi:hypothetical protein